MCGICGVVNGSGEGPDRELLRRMAARIRHRGPDDEGIVISGRAGIAARRLSIIDVEGGHQPIANEDETVWVVQNGEIYNFPELMDQLSARGHRFRTRSDTEVIVHLYEEYGVDFLDRLDGMFGLALWDTRTDTIILGRDRLGIKPLYYADLGDRLLFGSELKSILLAGLPRELDLDALDAYFALAYIPAPLTIFRSAKKLLPGHYLRWTSGRAMETAPYWKLPVATSDSKYDPRRTDELASELLSLLRAAVKSHLISDVPLGAFLSGGLDSSTVVALMAEHSDHPVQTFSIGFEERSYDETPYARQVAQLFGAHHRELIQKPDPVAMTEKLAWMYDEPFADSSALATYSVARLAREHVKVALTGDGGDEIFGGYLIYRADKLRSLYQRLPEPVREKAIRTLVNRLPTSDRKTSFDYKLKRFVRAASLPAAEAHAGWKTIFTRDVRERLLSNATATDIAVELMSQCFEHGPNGDLIGGGMHADTLIGMPDDMLTKVDRATMAVSLEARVPLLDRSVVEFMARLPSAYKVHGWTLKHLMKRAMRGIVPDEIIDRQKAGFNVPIAGWLRSDLREFMCESLSDEHVRTMGVFDPTVVQETISEHLGGRVDRGRELWALLMFSLWHAEYLETGSVEAERIRQVASGHGVAAR